MPSELQSFVKRVQKCGRWVPELFRNLSGGRTVVSTPVFCVA